MLQSSLPRRRCGTITRTRNHGSYAIFTCEFEGGLSDRSGQRKVLGYLKLSKKGMPQDIRVSPTANSSMLRTLDGQRRVCSEQRNLHRNQFAPPAWARTACIRAATARSSTSPAMDRTRSGPPQQVRSGARFRDPRRATWPIGGAAPTETSAPTASCCGSPAATTGISPSTPRAARSRRYASARSHGLTVWPQPGRYSLGHTGNMR